MMTDRFSRRAIVAFMSISAFVATSCDVDRGPARSDSSSDQGSVGGLAQAVAVRGHWTITVREPDGSLAHRHEFENAFVGERTVTRIFRRDVKPGHWAVNVTPDGPMCNPGSSDIVICSIFEEGSRAGEFRNLTLAPHTRDAGFTLAGHFVADRAGNVLRVETQVNLCPLRQSYRDCSRPDLRRPGAFTRTTPPSPIAVEAGQIVQVRVDIDFS